MPNGINEISPDLRDWLLNRNLILSPNITNNGLGNLAGGLGVIGSNRNITKCSTSTNQYK